MSIPNCGKVIPIFNGVDNYTLLSPYIILQHMTGEMLKEFTPKVSCMDGMCSVRYYLNKGELSMGIIRIQHSRKEGKIPQDILLITSMDLDLIIGHIMETQQLPIELGETIVNIIRMDATQRVKELINRGEE